MRRADADRAGPESRPAGDPRPHEKTRTVKGSLDHETQHMLVHAMVEDAHSKAQMAEQARQRSEEEKEKGHRARPPQVRRGSRFRELHRSERERPKRTPRQGISRGG
jgi:hypothetical protein